MLNYVHLKVSLAPLVIAFLITLTASSWTATSDSEEELAITQPQVLTPLEVHYRTNLTIVEQLRHNHYVKKELNDTASSQIFEKFIESLDRGRAYFTQQDIEEFEEFRYELDDLLKRGDLKPAFAIFNRYQTSLIDRLNFLIKEIDKGVDRINFELPDSIRIDRDELPWPANDKERDIVWQKRLKAAALSLRLNDKTDEEISEQLTKRY